MSASIQNPCPSFAEHDTFVSAVTSEIAECRSEGQEGDAGSIEGKAEACSAGQVFEEEGSRTSYAGYAANASSLPVGIFGSGISTYAGLTGLRFATT